MFLEAITFVVNFKADYQQIFYIMNIFWLFTVSVVLEINKKSETIILKGKNNVLLRKINICLTDKNYIILIL